MIISTIFAARSPKGSNVCISPFNAFAREKCSYTSYFIRM